MTGNSKATVSLSRTAKLEVPLQISSVKNLRSLDSLQWSHSSLSSLPHTFCFLLPLPQRVSIFPHILDEPSFQKQILHSPKIDEVEFSSKTLILML